MRMTVYGLRRDEVELFDKYAAENGVDISVTRRFLDAETVELAAGSEAISIVASCRLDAELARRLHELGVKYVLTRTAGYDHIDPDALRRYGLRCARVPVYSRNAVSEHTVMLLLALIRDLKSELFRVDRHIFRLPGAHARELGSMTVGIFGTGFIGGQTARMLSGFGCRILAYARHPRADLEGLVTYVTQEELFSSSDALIFHCSLNDSTRGIVNSGTISAMKDGVCLINTARGELMDFSAVLAGLRSGKIAGLATDVYVNEASFMRGGSGGEIDPVLAELISMDNVIFTHHIAFFTDTAVDNLIKITFENFREFETTGSCRNELFRGA